jgi:2'-5' RNA ligase
VSYRPKLFTGINLDGMTRSCCVLIKRRLEVTGLYAHYEKADKLHLTVAFLGWVNPDQVDVIEKTLRETAARVAPFSMTLDKIGAFPHERNAHIVWIGSSEKHPGFEALSTELRSGYEQLGFQFPKETIPHVTIARIKENRTHLPNVDFTPMDMWVSGITLFESLPGEETTRYEVLAEVELAG